VIRIAAAWLVAALAARAELPVAFVLTALSVLSR
jgi:hypothetical protein